MATPWDLAQAETHREQRRLQDEEREAVRMARRASHWYDVRTESSFTERSRRKRPGNLKTVEQYLRDDIHCGIDACPRCEARPQTRLFRPPRRFQRERSEYIVPDAFALLQCMELLEDAQFGAQVPHLLVLESVLQQALKIAPSRDATRLKNFFRDESRRRVEPCCVVLFPNQHHVETSVERAVLPQLETEAKSYDARAVPLETQVACDQRSMVKTLTWYATQHVASSSRLVVMTPDVDAPLSEQLHMQLGLEVTTCEDFVQKRFRNPGFLLELAVNTAEAVRWWMDRQVLESSDGTLVSSGEFTPHLPIAQLEDRVQKGDLIKGRLDVSAHNPMEAFVRVDKSVSGRSGLTKVFVYGKDAMNRGIHGDDVVVQLLPTSEWRTPQSERVLVHYSSADEPSSSSSNNSSKPQQNDKTRADSESESDERFPTAVVVGIAQRSSRFFVATVLSSTVAPGEDYALAIPMDQRIPKIRIRSQRMDALLDQRLKVVVDQWPMDSMYPQGHYTAVLGDTGSLATELSAILVENEIEEAPFCESALACLPDQCEIDTYCIQECSTTKRPDNVPLLDWSIPPTEIASRRDLRSTHRVFSVDPPGCQDIDDAMSVRKLPSGNIELGVHIADVSYFVQHDSPLDYEGRRRATTVYLVGQRLDMLPAVLSADLCSLHERVDRLAMSVMWEFDGKTLEVVDDKTWYGRTVINSCASMTYSQAHRILQGVNADTTHSNHPTQSQKANHRRGVAGGPVPLALQHELDGDLRLLTMISRKLAKARGEEGGLDLSRSETFSLNVSELGDGGTPTGVEIVMKESLEIHSTIAELMILANGYVAKKIVRAFPSNALLRRHVPPSGPRFQQLIYIAQAKQIEIDASNNYTLQQSLVNAERSGRADAKTMALLKSLAVRVMSEAEYICANAAETTEDQTQNQDLTSFAHYGLGLQYYTHFTSPIRRYADIVVHRQLLAAIELEKKGKSHQLLRDPKQGAAGGSDSSASGGVVLPPSLVPSVLDDGGDDEDFLDSLLADVDSKLHIEEPQPSVGEEKEESPLLLFPPSTLVPLSQHLNRKNRSAKQASRSCEELFLALYFSTHTVKTYAIITALKQNGFLVYVPTYDLRAPVYIRDRDGFVQMDPLLCGVRIVDTKPATGAFASADCIRLIPQAHIQYEPSSERLDVVVTATSDGGSTSETTFRILDEVEIQISCDLSGANARVPQLQLQLVGRVQKKQKHAMRHREVTMTTATPTTPTSKLTMPNIQSSIPEIQRIVQKRSAAEAAARGASPRVGKTTANAPASAKTAAAVVTNMYDLLQSEALATISPAVKKKLLTRPAKVNADPNPKLKANANDTTVTMKRRGPGRLVFGDYEPPRTQHYQQKLASYMGTRSVELEDELSIQRLASGASSAIGSQEEMKRVEKDAMTRMARLAAEKRHDKINKRSKAGH